MFQLNRNTGIRVRLHRVRVRPAYRGAPVAESRQDNDRA